MRIAAIFLGWALVAGCGRVERDPGVPETVDEVEPNGTCGSAQEIAAETSAIVGTFADGSDLDYYTFDLEAQTTVEIVTIPVAGDECGQEGRGSDTTLTLQPDDCGATIEFNDDGDPPASACSEIVHDLEPGSYKLLVQVFIGDVGPVIGTDRSYRVEIAR